MSRVRGPTTVAGPLSVAFGGLPWPSVAFHGRKRAARPQLSAVSSAFFSLTRTERP
ncbi:hypothetical protein GA0115254_118117 [Streptomyces sp. Ncost-T10-10d]|nr:hypothetical protein GA0115254_118117 [Streptomyces sp. Ncost-T10-10d]